MTLLVENRGAVRILTLNRPEKRNALDTELTRDAARGDLRAPTPTNRSARSCSPARAGLLRRRRPAEFKDLQDRGGARRAPSSRCSCILSSRRSPSRRHRDQRRGHGRRRGPRHRRRPCGDGRGREARLPGDQARHRRRDRAGNLVRQVGRKAAFELVALGEPIDAQRRLQLGMVNTVSREDLDKRCAWPNARGRKPSAMAETKRLFHEVADLPLEQALERAGRNTRMRSFELEMKPLDGLPSSTCRACWRARSPR
jgi:hypothetical protein